MIDAQELRRRWTDETSAVFSPQDRVEFREYAAETYERDFDFKGCKSISFFDDDGGDGAQSTLLMTQGSGHITLPAGVRVLVQSGWAKCERAASARGGGSGSSTVFGSGVRAPPPSRVSGYAPSSVGSAYRGASESRSNANNGYSRFGYNMSARDVPLPASEAGRTFGSSRAESGDWEVVAQMDGFERRQRDDVRTIVPEDSISSVGSRGSHGGASSYSRRFKHSY